MKNMEVKKSALPKCCQYCGKYDRCTKKCSESGKYTARKSTCDSFAERI